MKPIDDSIIDRRRKRSARFEDIARAAGLSVATVDRVLNERGSVSTVARERVLRAARRLDLPRTLPDAWHGLLHVQVILPRNHTPFWRRLDTAVQDAARLMPRHMIVHRSFVSEDDDDALVSAVVNPTVPRAALAVAATVSPRVRASLQQVMEAGTPVATMVSEVEDLPRHPFCGVDNHAAGRTAGMLMARLARQEARQQGRVLVLQANDWLQAHRARADGFRQALHHYAPTLACDVFITGENLHAAAAILRERMGEGVVGLYDTGCVSDAIADRLRPMPARPVWLGHEADALHRALLREGLLDFVLDQDPLGQAEYTLRTIARQCGLPDTGIVLVPPEIRLFCRENLRDDATSGARADEI